MSLLNEAIKVIERVRELHLVVKTTKDGSQVIGFTNKIDDVGHFEERLILLQEQLELFDVSQGSKFDDLVLKPDLNPLGKVIDPELAQLENKVTFEKNQASNDVPSIPEPLAMKLASAPAKQTPGKELTLNFEYSFEDAVNDSSDSALAEDCLHDKLTFAINKVGWNPKTRNLALALKRLEDKLGALDREKKIELGVEWQLILESSIDYIYSENQSPIRNIQLDLEDDYVHLPTPKPQVNY